MQFLLLMLLVAGVTTHCWFPQEVHGTVTVYPPRLVKNPTVNYIDWFRSNTYPTVMTPIVETNSNCPLFAFTLKLYIGLAILYSFHFF